MSAKDIMKTVETVAIMGAGVMGSGIAQVCSQSGLNVNLVDISNEILSKSISRIHKNLKRLASEGKTSAESVEEALGRIHRFTDLTQAVREADLVIESVPEKQDLKVRLFAELDKTARADAVLVSNTSSVSIAELAAATTRRERVIGIHFFNPVAVSAGVELIRIADTSEQTMAIAKGFLQEIGKQPIVVKDSPGFLINRLLPLLVNESLHLLQEGIASAEEIDKACTMILKHPIGPLRMADLAGLDTVLYVLEYMHEKFGVKYRPCSLLQQMVDEGRHGRKTGEGVYKYEGTE